MQAHPARIRWYTTRVTARVPAATRRLVFRAWHDDDLPLAQALFGDPRVTELVGGPFADDAVRARLATEIATQREHGFQYWPIFLHDGTHVGCCGLKPRAASVHELGFYLRVEHWGKGYAVEAGQSAIAFAFDVLGVASLFAGHHPENAGSRRTLEKLGFVYTHRELYPPTGLMHPGYARRR
jgi:[ribosomal protein S5]-alanine N-acetyltransferase